MKRRILSVLLCTAMALAAVPVSGCSSAPVTRNSEPFMLSCISDTAGEDGNAAYAVTVPYTDTYTLTCESDDQFLEVFEQNRIVGQGNGSLNLSLSKGLNYTVQIKTHEDNAPFVLRAQADHHLVTLPYGVGEYVDTSGIDTQSVSGDPLVPAKIDYQKRQGGTYIYVNNPEQVPAGDVGKAFLKNEGLTGEVYMTFENANYSGKPFYLGYRLQNEGETDVYVTVTNIGYQVGGTWFGQMAWYDFYNTSFELPKDYFTSNGKYLADFAYQKYIPRVYQPTTYRLPAGESFYVIGGTTKDAYRNINVDGTADKPLSNNKCANGNVKFTVTGGSVTGLFCCYNDLFPVSASNPEVIGYRTGKYAVTYNGSDAHAGIIDNSVTWTFNDETDGGFLPVTYTNRYADKLPTRAKPYEAYDSTDHTVEKARSWMTHLNPQNDHKAVGTDMVNFHCTDEKGNPVVIDNDHADGGGNTANTANWMIEYQDHFLLVNRGEQERTVTLNLQDHGTLAVLARDGETGEVLEAKYTCGLGNVRGNTYSYAVSVPAHSIRQVTLDYCLVACSYGSVNHSATLSEIK